MQGRREQTGGGNPQPPAAVPSHEEGWIQPLLPSQPQPSLSCGRSACELSGEIHGQALEPRPAVSSSKGLGAPCSWGLPSVHTGPWVNLFFNFIDKGTKAGGWGPVQGQVQSYTVNSPRVGTGLLVSHLLGLPSLPWS